MIFHPTSRRRPIAFFRRPSGGKGRAEAALRRWLREDLRESSDGDEVTLSTQQPKNDPIAFCNGGGFCLKSCGSIQDLRRGLSIQRDSRRFEPRTRERDTCRSQSAGHALTGPGIDALRKIDSLAQKGNFLTLVSRLTGARFAFPVECGRGQLTEFNSFGAFGNGASLSRLCVPAILHRAHSVM